MFKHKLREWGLEKYIEKFDDEEIDDESFPVLTSDTIKSIFTKGGPYSKFLRYYNEWKQSTTSNVESGPACHAPLQQKKLQAHSKSPDDRITSVPAEIVTETVTMNSMPYDTVSDSGIVPPEARSQVARFIQNTVDFREQKQWWQLEEMIKSAVRQIIDVQKHVEVVKKQSALSRKRALLELKMLLEKEKKESLPDAVDILLEGGGCYRLEEDGSVTKVSSSDRRQDKSLEDSCIVVKEVSSIKQEVPVTTKRRRTSGEADGTEDFIHEALKNNYNGTLALSEFSNFGCLSPNSQQLVAECVILHEIKGDIEKKITAARFLELANKIVEYIPSESVSTYYIPWHKDQHNKKRGASGKLVDLLYNTRRKANKLGFKLNKASRPSSDEDFTCDFLDLNSSEEAYSEISPTT